MICKTIRQIKRWLPLLFVLLSLTVCPAPALAHSVLTDYRLVAESLEIQASFTTGEALNGAEVVVYAPNDPTHPWLKGVTDPEGNFAFEPDRALPGEWVVKIGAGDHGDELAVPVSNQGIDIDAISHSPYESPHPFAKQMIVAGVLLGSSLGTTGLIRWRRWRRG